MNRFAIIALSIATAFSGTPAAAGPAFVPNPVQSGAEPAPANTDARIMTVGCSRFSIVCSRYGDRRRYYGNRRYYRDRHYYRGDRYSWDRRYDRRWRRHDNTGAIIGGLAAGAIIGGIIASQPRAYHSRAYGSHAEYCYSRYRSYRAWDNTYQPYYGPRRQCR
ncbi:BA14K family protein [Rhizobium bangladeshense]|uniref:BA14K family protein n=1 Tax=Rhizobium bangladeshense TaxID=1138189 RepID=UPI001C84081E|nr:BA14K family protein [Rhizobium bangladeshense]MBX4897422.1 BA14K family protein [Rhizobium bangladeshense]MBY3615281.1 BA14K family protein [Rhizobium bangladeshense]